MFDWTIEASCIMFDWTIKANYTMFDWTIKASYISPSGRSNQLQLLLAVRDNLGNL